MFHLHRLAIFNLRPNFNIVAVNSNKLFTVDIVVVFLIIHLVEIWTIDKITSAHSVFIVELMLSYFLCNRFQMYFV